MSLLRWSIVVVETIKLILRRWQRFEMWSNLRLLGKHCLRRKLTSKPSKSTMNKIPNHHKTLRFVIFIFNQSNQSLMRWIRWKQVLLEAWSFVAEKDVDKLFAAPVSSFSVPSVFPLDFPMNRPTFSKFTTIATCSSLIWVECTCFWSYFECARFTEVDLNSYVVHCDRTWRSENWILAWNKQILLLSTRF